MRICSAIHSGGANGKGAKYLLITQSFPHSPQLFPQELSTGELDCGYSFLVHIKQADRLRPFSHFFAGGGFLPWPILCAKNRTWQDVRGGSMGLSSRAEWHGVEGVTHFLCGIADIWCAAPPARAGWQKRFCFKIQIFWKKGLILFDESAIMCVCMENFEEGGALHAQH